YSDFFSVVTNYNGPVWYVSVDGNDFTGDGSYDNPYEHIQWAADQASSGDTVLIMSGSYEENISLDNKNLAFIGFSPDSLSIISPQTTSQVTFYISNVETVSLKQLSIIGNGEGAGLWAYDCSQSILEDVLFEGFGDYGAKFSNSGSGETEAILKNVVVRNNSTGLNILGTTCSMYDAQIDSNERGIKFSTGEGHDLNLNKVNFYNNSIDDIGAGLYIDQAPSSSTVTIDSCEFINNSSTNSGAAIFSRSNELWISNSIFRANYTPNGGSAIYVDPNDSPGINITDCYFINNTGHQNGTTIRTASITNIYNCIFLSSDGPVIGGVNPYNIENIISITNSIFWNNPVVSGVWSPLDNINIIYSCIENGWPGTGNIDDDPKICDPYSNSFQLSSDSPCVGTGWNNENMGGLDVGCEQVDNTLSLDATAPDGGTGSDENPINNLEDAVTYVFDGDSILINPGNYNPENEIYITKSIDFIGQDSSKTVIVIDGGTFLSANTQDVNVTKLGFKNLKFLGDGWTSDYTFMLYFGEYVFSNCIFQNIHNTYNLRVSNSSLQIDNCTFDNGATGVYDIVGWGDSEANNDVLIKDIFVNQPELRIAIPSLTDSLFVENLLMDQKNVDIEVGYINLMNSYFNNCSITINAESADIEENIFSDCSSFDQNLIFLGNDGMGLIDHCLFNKNHASYALIGSASQNSFIINNSTFANNTERLFELVNGSHGDLINSIIQTAGADILFYNGTSDQSFSANYNLIDFGPGDGWGQSDYTEENVIYGDPLFVNPANDDYHLQWASPAIDAGDPDSPLDPDGSRADMGAFYFDQSDTIPPTVSIIGLSSTEVGTENQITVTWSANDNWLLDSAFVDILHSDETVIRADTTLAETGESTIDVPDSTLNSFQLIVTVWDYLHNEATDTSEVITVFDNTPPEVTV
nr:hypothetical protein [Candidatus Neomarinimicrobiota bacterium]